MTNAAASTTTQRHSGEQAQQGNFTPSADNGVDPLLDRSTDTKSQLNRILAALRRGPKTTNELRALGIYMPNSRVFALRAKGYSIATHLVLNAPSADGLFVHRKMALYTLSEPSDAWVKNAAAESPPPEDDCQAFKDWMAADAQKGGA